MTKKEIRKLFLEKRKSLSKEDFNNLESALFGNILDHFNFNEKVVHVFLPIQNKNEINTFNLIELIRSRHKQTTWVVPKCNFINQTLDHFHFDKDTHLEKSDYGIPEPVNAKMADIKDIGIVLVPLLAADKSGDRVGYGMGFYDRFLSRCGPDTIFVGLSIFEPLDLKIETNAYDIPLHFVASPEKILNTSDE